MPIEDSGPESELRRELASQSNRQLLASVDFLGKGKLTAEGERIALELLRERGVPVNHCTTCPRCSEALVKGEVVIRGGFWSFLLVGFSYQELFFERDGTRAKRSILRPHRRRPALRCPSCRLLIAEP